MNQDFGEGFSCPLGAEVMLRVEKRGVQLKSSLVGMDRSNFIILKTPKHPAMDAALAVEEPVKAVFVHDGTIFGFVSKVIGAVDMQEPLYLLAFPKSMDRRELRRDRRIQCLIPACVHKDGKSDYPCMVTNLSSGGCGVTIGNTDRHLPTGIMIESVLELSCEMLDIRKERPVRSIVKNMSESAGKIHLGFQFDTTDADIVERVQSYVDRVQALLPDTPS